AVAAVEADRDPADGIDERRVHDDPTGLPADLDELDVAAVTVDRCAYEVEGRGRDAAAAEAAGEAVAARAVVEEPCTPGREHRIPAVVLSVEAHVRSAPLLVVDEPRPVPVEPVHSGRADDVHRRAVCADPRDRVLRHVDLGTRGT